MLSKMESCQLEKQFVYLKLYSLKWYSKENAQDMGMLTTSSLCTSKDNFTLHCTAHNTRNK